MTPQQEANILCTAAAIIMARPIWDIAPDEKAIADAVLYRCMQRAEDRRNGTMPKGQR